MDWDDRARSDWRRTPNGRQMEKSPTFFVEISGLDLANGTVADQRMKTMDLYLRWAVNGRDCHTVLGGRLHLGSNQHSMC